MSTTRDVAIQPGWLVSLKTRVRGNVKYFREDLGQTVEGLTQEAQWKTTRIIRDCSELTNAEQTRSAIGVAIRRNCIDTPFGLLLRNDRLADFDTAVESCKEVRDRFNAGAEHTRIEFYVVKGYIAENDVEAARSILAMVQSEVDNIRVALDNCDIDALRKASSNAKKFGQMLNESEADRVNGVVKIARQAARKLAKEIAERGTTMVEVAEVEEMKAAINETRFAFLDVSDSVDMADVQVVNEARFAGVEAN